MKNSSIFLLVWLLFTGCNNNKQSENSTFITVDVTVNYPEKGLILQDFMDVEYIPLETTNEFLNQGNVLAIGKEIIVVNNHTDDGDIFIYDRNGKGLRKINQKGGSGAEYTSISKITLDEDNGEMFVNDRNKKNILVYDLYGKFKRSFPHKEGVRFTDIFNFEKGSLICNDGTLQIDGLEERGRNSHYSHYIVSKQDGSIIREIEIPYKQAKSPIIIHGQGRITERCYSSIIPYRGNWILVEPSSDTVFCYSPDYIMTPFMVRTPSIQSMSPEMFLFPLVISSRYYFMQIFKKENNAPIKNLIYDRQAQAVFEYTLYSDDFSDKRTLNLNLMMMNVEAGNDDVAFCYKLEAYQLVESYKNDELKGKLKEIAAKLDEDDNPVIMLVKYKK